MTYGCDQANQRQALCQRMMCSLEVQSLKFCRFHKRALLQSPLWNLLKEKYNPTYPRAGSPTSHQPQNPRVRIHDGDKMKYAPPHQLGNHSIAIIRLLFFFSRSLPRFASPGPKQPPPSPHQPPKINNNKFKGKKWTQLEQQ